MCVVSREIPQMKRKIYDRLLEWKQKDAGRSALLIDGARRVGKSYIAEEFAKREYKSHVLIDFSKADDDVKDVFRHYLEHLDTFFLKLSGSYGVTLHERNTLFIFDEVQEFPRAREAIKALVADGRYDYLETGSLVSIDKSTRDIVIPSEEDRVKMFPMDFEEFLWAKGDETTMPMIRGHFERMEPLGRLLHRRAMDAFREYMAVGGMPQAVLEFVSTNDLGATDRAKRKILKLYREDIDKHCGRSAAKVKRTFDAIPAQLSRHEKKYRISELSPQARFRDYEDAFSYLRESMVANICVNSTEPNLGLNLNAERNTFKCYLCDTGLLVSQAFGERELVAEQIHRRLLMDSLEINKGMLVENVVAQMLRAAGHELFFFSKSDAADRSERMEVDFLIAKPSLTRRRNISPVEVKSSKRYDHTSLDKFTRKYRQFLHVPYVLHPKDVVVQDGITYLPLYMAPCL